MAMSHSNLPRDMACSSLHSEEDDIMRVIPKYRHVIMSFCGLHYRRRTCDHLTLPQSLNLSMEFSVGICTIILFVINLPTKSLTEMLRQ